MVHMLGFSEWALRTVSLACLVSLSREGQRFKGPVQCQPACRWKMQDSNPVSTFSPPHPPLSFLLFGLQSCLCCPLHSQAFPSTLTFLSRGGDPSLLSQGSCVITSDPGWDGGIEEI